MVGATGQALITRRSKPWSAGVATLAMFILLGMFAPQVAAAKTPHTSGGVDPDFCVGDTWYSHNDVYNTLRDMTPPVTGQSGTQISISISKGTTIGSTIGGSGSFSISAVVFSATNQIDGAIQRAMTTQVTYGGSWTVPRAWAWGKLHGGGKRYHSVWGHWRYGYRNGSCVPVRFGHGTGYYPWEVPTFWHTRGQ